MPCQSYSQRRTTNGNQLDNKRLLNKEKMRSFTAAVPLCMAPEKRRMELLWQTTLTGETYNKLTLMLCHNHKTMT